MPGCQQLKRLKHVNISSPFSWPQSCPPRRSSKIPGPAEIATVCRYGLWLSHPSTTKIWKPIFHRIIPFTKEKICETTSRLKFGMYQRNYISIGERIWFSHALSRKRRILLQVSAKLCVTVCWDVYQPECSNSVASTTENVTTTVLGVIVVRRCANAWVPSKCI